MEEEEWGYYSVKSPDGYDLACHAIKGRQPDGAEEITAERAKEIDDATTARTMQPAPPQSPVNAQLAASIDLKPLLDKIDALQKVVTDQASELDAHASQIKAQEDLINQKDEEARQRTINALEALTAKIGEKAG